MISGLPKRLKELRVSSGYSQQAVAFQLKVSPSIISGYETGERTPSIDNLIGLSNLYRCSVDYLLGKSTNLQDSIDVSGLNPKQIKIVNEIVKEFKQK